MVNGAGKSRHSAEQGRRDKVQPIALQKLDLLRTLPLKSFRGRFANLLPPA
jgi:hypothetical protein